MNYEQQLYDYIASRGSAYDEVLHIVDNSGEPVEGHEYAGYLVHIKGGVFFEISKSAEGYFFEDNWHGPLGICTAQQAIGYLMILEQL